MTPWVNPWPTGPLPLGMISGQVGKEIEFISPACVYYGEIFAEKGKGMQK